MAVVSVTSNNTRVDDADALTGWLGIGGGQGASAEPSFPYQGTNLVNRKVTSSTGAGFYYDPASDGGFAVDMTAASTRTWLVKAIVTDYGGLQAANGLRIRIGSGTTAYYEYVIAGTNSVINRLNEYPTLGGFIFVPIDPNIVGYRNSTTGSPSLTAVDYFGVVAAFTASTSKSENLGLDAIDLGTGLTLTGGDGADTDGVFQDFVDDDQGTISNRWGYVTSNNGSVNVFGMLTIGSGTATEFTDNNAKVQFLDGYFQAGWSGITINLQNSSSVVEIGSEITGLGDSNIEDTRPDHIVTGTLGSYTFNGSLNNHRNVELTSSVTITDAFIECVDLQQSNANISNSTITTLSESGVAFCDDADFTNLQNITFNQGNLGHVIEITSAGTYSFDNLTFDGYGADGTNAAAIYNNSGGSVTINILNGGTTPTVRNGIGASTTINNTVTIRVTVLDAVTLNPIENTRVLLEADTGGDLSTGTDILAGLTNVSGVIEDTGFNFTNNQPVIGRVRKGSSSPYYKTGNIVGTITSSGFDTTILLISDE